MRRAEKKKKKIRRKKEEKKTKTNLQILETNLQKTKFLHRSFPFLLFAPLLQL